MDRNHKSSLTETNQPHTYSVDADAKLRDACDAYRVNHAAWRRHIETHPEIERYDEAPEDLNRHSDLWRNSLNVIVTSAAATPAGAVLKLEVLTEHSKWACACTDTADLLFTATVELKAVLMRPCGSRD